MAAMGGVRQGALLSICGRRNAPHGGESFGDLLSGPLPEIPTNLLQTACTPLQLTLQTWPSVPHISSIIVRVNTARGRASEEPWHLAKPCLASAVMGGGDGICNVRWDEKWHV